MRSARANSESSNYRLDGERIQQLDAIGMRRARDSWEVRYRLAGQRQKHDSQEKGKHALTEEQEKKLEAIGMEW